MSDTYTYQLTESGGNDYIVVTVNSTATDGTGDGPAYAVTSISGTIDGVSIDFEIGTPDSVQNSTPVNGEYYIYDNALFLSGSSGADGSVDGLDNDGILFSAGGVDYNLYSQNGSLFLAIENNGVWSNVPVTVLSTNAPCFCRGTLIMTARGEAAVEDLREGDLLVTRFGPVRPIKWIGRHSYAGAFLKRERSPVCIKAGALDNQLPRRDLYVSPGHRMAIDDVLVRAQDLVNGVTITQETTQSPVDYYHIDFGVHGCVIAEGTWSESYAEQGNRDTFHNAASFTAAFPDHVPAYQTECLPLAECDDARLVAVQLKVLKNVPGAVITSDAALHLVADGRRIEAESYEHGTSVFRVPRGAQSLRLASNACRPMTVGINRDERLLGVRLHSVTANHGDVVVSLALDSDALKDGWSRLEHTQDGRSFRWTNGDAVLPAALVAGAGADILLRVKWGGLARYFIAPEVRLGTSEAEGGVLLAA